MTEIDRKFGFCSSFETKFSFLETKFCFVSYLLFHFACLPKLYHPAEPPHIRHIAKKGDPKNMFVLGVWGPAAPQPLLLFRGASRPRPPDSISDFLIRFAGSAPYRGVGLQISENCTFGFLGLRDSEFYENGARQNFRQNRTILNSRSLF